MASTQCRAVYEITVEGELDPDWQPWLHGLAISASQSAHRPPVTTLIGPLADQAALRGLLARLWDLNLTLLAVRHVDWEDNKEASDG